MQEEIRLTDLFKVIFAAKGSVITIIMVGGLLAYGVGITLPNQYRAEALVVPIDDNDSGMTPFPQEFGGLAALAGVSLGSATQNNASLAIELLRSRIFLSQFIQKHTIGPQLLAVDYWDEGTRELVIDADIYDQASGSWVATSSNDNNGPSEEQLFRALKDRIEVIRIQKTGFITIAVTHRSPTIAKQWVDWLIADINDQVRAKDIEESRESIKFLRIQASQNSFADLDQAFFELIQSQMQRMMLANVRGEYVFDTVDPAFAPEKPFSPNRFLILLLGLVIGALLAIALVLVKQFLREP